MKEFIGIKKLNWIESSGGPLLLLPHKLVHFWGGINTSSNGDNYRTDYDRICDIQDDITLISVSEGEGVVLGGEPLSTSWISASNKSGVFIRWRYAYDELAVLEYIRTSQTLVWELSYLTFTINEQDLVLFDSALPGTDIEEHLEIGLELGTYTIETAHFEPDQSTSLVLHRLNLLVGDSKTEVQAGNSR
jgi:hypothetical protein